MKKCLTLLIVLCALFASTGCDLSASTKTDYQVTADISTIETTEPTTSKTKTEFYDYLIILDGNVTSPNSAGAVDVQMEFRNKSYKAIKYIYYTVTPYNAVDRPVACTVTGKSDVRLQFTGPLKAESNLIDYIWRDVWYGYAIDHYVIKKIEIDFMDGERVSFDTALPMPLF